MAEEKEKREEEERKEERAGDTKDAKDERYEPKREGADSEEKRGAEGEGRVEQPNATTKDFSSVEPSDAPQRKELSPFMKSKGRARDNDRMGTETRIQQQPEGGEGGVEMIVRNIERAAADKNDIHACLSMNERTEL